MSRICVVLLLVLVVVSAGCGYSSHNYMGNGALQISQLSPSNEMHGNGDFLLTVTGTGFASGAVVYWGATPQASSAYMSTTQVTATIAAADIANAGMVQVYVRSGGTNSNALTFTIQ